MHILQIGLGQIGLALAQCLYQQGHKVTAVSRHQPQSPFMFNHLMLDARTLHASHLGEVASTVTHLMIIVAPDTHIADRVLAYQESYYAIAHAMIKLSSALPRLERVAFVSSTGVYGQHQGEWIDINTPIEPPHSQTSRVLLEAEYCLQHHFLTRCTIVRPSGIYGKQRLRLVKMAKNIAAHQMIPPDNTWTNRIMDTDLVHVLAHIIGLSKPLPLYLATDQEPVPLYTVLNFIAKHHLDLDTLIPDEVPQTGKRILGNVDNWLTYPTYRHGYA